MKSDAELIEETLAGQTQSFGVLVERYQHRLFTSMFRVVGKLEESEDVAQEAFVQAFRKLSSFQGSSAFYTWVYRIAFNISASRRRRQRPMASLEQRREESGDPAGNNESVSAGLEREEDRQRLWAALVQLSDEHRVIMVMREMEGCDYETIGGLLDIPVGTVRSRLHRARSHLRELLQGDFALDETDTR